mgnify:CR=1 FL=1
MEISCECGNIQVDWNTRLNKLLARRCGCSYCQSQCAEYVSDPNSTLKLKILNPLLHNVVTHGSETSLFHECINCGLIFVTSEIGGRTYGLLNLQALEPSDYSVDPISKDFSTETLEQRLARRQQNWCKFESIL